MRGERFTLSTIQRELDKKYGEGEFVVLKFTSTAELTKFRHRCGAIHDVLFHNILRHTRRCEECGKGYSKNNKPKITKDVICNELHSSLTPPADINSQQWFSHLQDGINQLYGKGDFFVMSFNITNPLLSSDPDSPQHSITLCHKCGNTTTFPYKGIDKMYYDCPSCNARVTLQQKLDALYPKGEFTILSLVKEGVNSSSGCIVQHTCGNTLLTSPSTLLDKQISCEGCLAKPDKYVSTSIDLTEGVTEIEASPVDVNSVTTQTSTEAIALEIDTKEDKPIISEVTNTDSNTDSSAEAIPQIRLRKTRILPIEKVQEILDKAHGAGEYKVIDYLPISSDQKYPFVVYQHNCSLVKKDYFANVRKPNYRCPCMRTGKLGEDSKKKALIVLEDSDGIAQEKQELLLDSSAQKPVVQVEQITETPKEEEKPKTSEKGEPSKKEEKSKTPRKKYKLDKTGLNDILWAMQQQVNAEFGSGKYKVLDHEKFGGYDIYTFKHNSCGEEIKSTLSTLQAKKGICRKCGK